VHNDTTAAGAATLLLDLDGLAVERVERTPDGGRLVRLVTEDEAARACPTCGVFSCEVKEVVCTRPRDLPCGAGGLVLVWVKRRWYCRERLCQRASFTESLPVLPARARITTRLRAEAGDRVKDGTCATVVASARQLGLSWPTVMDALRQQAAPLLDDAPAPVEVLGIDEVRRASAVATGQRAARLCSAGPCSTSPGIRPGAVRP
jgi:transposase